MLRVLRPMTAAWLVAAFMLAAVMPLADTRHALFDDPLCADPAQSGNQADRFRAASGTLPDDHCAVCHLQRAVRHAALSSALVAAAVSSGAAGPDRAGLLPPDAPIQYSSSRAPPAL
jgi:uncharacterized membrane protein